MSDNQPIVSVTPEIFISSADLQRPHVHHTLPPTGTGGLGAYMQTLLHGSFDIGENHMFVAPLSRRGYYDQGVTRDQDGIPHMTAGYGNYTHWDEYVERPDKELSLSISDAPVAINSHRYAGSKKEFGNGIFLDSDHKGNKREMDRVILSHLYGGTKENGCNEDRQIALAIALGVGSVEAIKAYGISPRVWHINEAWSALNIIYRVGLAIENGLDMEQAIAKEKEITVATIHTPVAAGNPKFSLSRMLEIGKTIPGFTKKVLLRLGDNGDGKINLAYINLLGSRKVNCVSKTHAKVAEEMYEHLKDKAPIIAITNSASRRWMFPEFEKASSIKDMKQAHHKYLQKVLNMVHRQYPDKSWSRNTLTVTFARRFTAYKRPELMLLSDLEWTKQLMYDQKVQVIIAGRPNPDETAMVDVYNHYLALADEYHNLAVLPGYEYRQMRLLQAGSHLWVNTPRFPNEACGTSGMKPYMMGGINMSIPDGWCNEINRECFFPFGSTHPEKWSEPERIQYQDEYDAADFTGTMKQAEHMWYNKRKIWWQKSWMGMQSSEYWKEVRMATEYRDLLFTP